MKVIPENFDGDIVINGSIESEYEDIFIYTNNCDIYILGNIYSKYSIEITGNVFCTENIICKNFIDINGCLYSDTDYIEAKKLSVEGDLIAKNAEIFVDNIIVAGDMEVKNFQEPIEASIFGSVSISNGFYLS